MSLLQSGRIRSCCCLGSLGFWLSLSDFLLNPIDGKMKLSREEHYLKWRFLLSTKTTEIEFSVNPLPILLPPPHNFVTHPVYHIKYISFPHKISSFSFLDLYFVLPASLPLKKEVLLCWELLGCTNKSLLFGVMTGRSAALAPSCCSGPGTQTPLPPAPLLAPHFLPPTSHPGQCGLVPALSTQMFYSHFFHPRTCLLEGGIRSHHS